LSELLFEMQRSLLQWTSPFQSSNADRDEQRRKAGEALDELIAYYRSSSVWLEPRTCEKIESFLNTTQDAAYKYVDELNERGHPQNKAGRDASLQLQSELPALRKELEVEFRAILYPARWYDAPLRLLAHLRTRSRKTDRLETEKQDEASG
jgi:hypothetical protein